MKEIISTRQIQLGMFVTELDRPWLETPFLLQGFLVDAAAQLADLQQYCATVTIDRSRSIGLHYAAVRYKVNGRHPDRASGTAAAVKTAPDSFYTVCRTLREKPPRRGANKTVPQIFGHDNQSQLETELLYSAPLVDQLIQCIGLYPIGTLVELNSGEVGVVIQQNQVRRLKPRVMIVLGPDKSIERRPRTLDLIMEPATGAGAPYHIVRSLPMDAYGIDPADFYLG